MLIIYPVELAAELKTGSRLPTGEYTVRRNSTRLNMYSFQFRYQIRQQLLRASCEFNTRRATPTWLNSTVESRRRRKCVAYPGFRKAWKHICLIIGLTLNLTTYVSPLM